MPAPGGRRFGRRSRRARAAAEFPPDNGLIDIYRRRCILTLPSLPVEIAPLKSAVARRLRERHALRRVPCRPRLQRLGTARTQTRSRTGRENSTSRNAGGITVKVELYNRMLAMQANRRDVLKGAAIGAAGASGMFSLFPGK